MWAVGLYTCRFSSQCRLSTLGIARYRCTLRPGIPWSAWLRDWAVMAGSRGLGGRGRWCCGYTSWVSGEDLSPNNISLLGSRTTKSQHRVCSKALGICCGACAHPQQLLMRVGRARGCDDDDHNTFNGLDWTNGAIDRFRHLRVVAWAVCVEYSMMILIPSLRNLSFFYGFPLCANGRCSTREQITAPLLLTRIVEVHVLY